MFNNLRHNKKGSITVEASLIVPVVILVVIVMVYMLMLMYQKAYIQSVANQSAENGAAMWNSPYKDIFMQQILKKNMKNTLPYWRIFDGNKADKLDKVEEYAKYYVEKYSIVGFKRESEAFADLNDKIIYKKLVVVITHKYYLPGGNLLRQVGLNPEQTFVVKSEAVINEPSEFIRNTDFVVDVVREIDQATGSHGQNFKEKIGDKFSKMIQRIVEFLD
ncbi:MAG: TadE/TadG family type IV pilus assembly protein [Bacillota bacterium]